MGGCANDELCRAGEVDLRSCAPQLLMEMDGCLPAAAAAAASWVAHHRGHERSAPAFLTLSSRRLTRLYRLSRSACLRLGRGEFGWVGLGWLDSIARVGSNE